MGINRPLKTNLLNVDLILEKAKIKEGQKIGDFGCGRNGNFVFLTAQQAGKNGLVYAVDIMKNNLESIAQEAKEQNLHQIKTIWSDVEMPKGTKIEENTLDLILLINLLHEANKPINVLKEAIRLLKKGGRLLIVDWKKTSSPIGPAVETRINKDLLASVSSKNGLIKEMEFEAGQYHFGLIFIKA